MRKNNFFIRVLRNPMGAIGIGILVFIAALCLFAPFISKYKPESINASIALMPPSPQHLLGTDSLGRDVFACMLYGGRVSLSVGFVAVGIATIVGVLLGILAGFYGGWVDEAISRFIDVMLCFPSFFLILSLVALAQKPSVYIVMAIIGLTGWMPAARLVRAEVLSLKERNFVHAAALSGISKPRIILKHILPQAIAPVLVNAALSLAGAVLIESSLSFLGLGVQPPQPSWGNILMEAKSSLGVAWWMSLFPGMAIFLTVLGFNFLGEAIREAYAQNSIFLK